MFPRHQPQRKDEPMPKMIPAPRLLAIAALATVSSAIGGCVSVNAPDKPIDINLNVTIRQEVLVRLERDVETLINQNPEAFPQPQQPR
jgi:hypothetical protein